MDGSTLEFMWQLDQRFKAFIAGIASALVYLEGIYITVRFFADSTMIIDSVGPQIYKQNGCCSIEPTSDEVTSKASNH